MSKKYCYVFGKKLPLIKETDDKSIWINGDMSICQFAEITDKKWLDDYKNKLHPNDDWTNINIETYARWIDVINHNERLNLIEAALNAKVVGYLD